MRGFKYRVWDKDDKKMYKLVAFSESIYGECEQTHALICGFEEDPSMPKTNVRISYNFKLMQSTGLKDKNGIEMYEGDIIKNTYCNDVVIEYIQWNESDARFRITNYNGGFDFLYDFACEDGYEIIGNIFENKDLPKEYFGLQRIIKAGGIHG